MFSNPAECLPLKNIENLPTLLNTNKIMYTIWNLCRDVLTICNIHTCYIFLQYTGTVYKYNIITYIYCTQKCKQLYYMYLIYICLHTYVYKSLLSCDPVWLTSLLPDPCWPSAILTCPSPPTPPPNTQGMHKIRMGGEGGRDWLRWLKGSLTEQIYSIYLSYLFIHCTVQCSNTWLSGSYSKTSVHCPDFYIQYSTIQTKNCTGVKVQKIS